MVEDASNNDILQAVNYLKSHINASVSLLTERVEDSGADSG